MIERIYSTKKEILDAKFEGIINDEISSSKKIENKILV
jgi:hypothetical protein